MVKKILLITLSNIGDAVMTTPVLEFFYKKYPLAKFDLVCDRRSYEIFKFFPRINKIFLKEKNTSLKRNYEFIKLIRKIKYDIAVDLRTDILLYFVRAYCKYPKIKNNNIHSCEKHLSSLRLEKIPEISPKIYIPLEIEKKISKIIAVKKNKVVSVGMGSNDDEKIWPIDNYIKLLTLLKRYFDLIILVGDRNDESRISSLVSSSKLNILNLCGKLSLLETSCVIRKSSFFIGNDSGLGHIASAVETASFTIFGKGNPKIYKPYGKKAYYFQNSKKNIKIIKVETIHKRIKKLFLGKCI